MAVPTNERENTTVSDASPTFKNKKSTLAVGSGVSSIQVGSMQGPKVGFSAVDPELATDKRAFRRNQVKK